MTKRIKKIIAMFLFSILLLPVSVYATTRNAASCSVADITAALALSNNGDTIKVPAGSCTWTTELIMDRSVTLIGAGADLGGSSSKTSCNPATNTCITINGSTAYITVRYNIADGWRISGISFTTADPGYTAIWNGTNPTTYKGWRIDHCKFVGFHFATFFSGEQASSTTSSVVDQNEFYGGGVQFFGVIDTPWAENTNLGSAKFIFIEDNKFSDLGALQQVGHSIATNGGARVVVRYNDFIVEETGTYGRMDDIFDAHGYCHGSNIRAVRAYEIYNNTQTQTSTKYCGEGVYLRGGTGVIYNNQFGCTSYGRGTSVALYDYRAANMDATGTETCSASCSTNSARKPYCHSTYYRLKTTADPATAFSSSYNYVVTGQTSGASGTVIGFTNIGDGGAASDHYYIYFLSISGGTFQNGENLQVGGITKTTAAAASEVQSGEGAGNCCDMIGKGNAQASDPVYIWGNTDKNGNALSDATTTGMVSGYITENVNYIKGVKPGYSPYQYPHPLTYPKPPPNPIITIP
jgi:hypothetical protein